MTPVEPVAATLARVLEQLSTLAGDVKEIKADLKSQEGLKGRVGTLEQLTTKHDGVISGQRKRVEGLEAWSNQQKGGSSTMRWLVGFMFAAVLIWVGWVSRISTAAASAADRANQRLEDLFRPLQGEKR